MSWLQRRIRGFKQRTADNPERGGVGLWILVMLPSVVLFVGVSWDVGNMLAIKREADNIAASAARAGAQVVDQETLYIHNAAGSDGRPGLDTVEAERRAIQLAEAQGGESVAVSFELIGSGSRVDVINVTVERTYNPTLLQLIGYNEVKMEGSSSARIRSSIESDEFDNREYVGG